MYDVRRQRDVSKSGTSNRMSKEDLYNKLAKKPPERDVTIEMPSRERNCDADCAAPCGSSAKVEEKKCLAKSLTEIALTKDSKESIGDAEGTISNNDVYSYSEYDPYTTDSGCIHEVDESEEEEEGMVVKNFVPSLGR